MLAHGWISVFIEYLLLMMGFVSQIFGLEMLGCLEAI